MPVTSFQEAIPIEVASQAPQPAQAAPGIDGGATSYLTSERDTKLVSFVTKWRNHLQTARIDKQNIWNECWMLYRGLEDFRDKEEWQSQIVLPKSFASVKQATNVIKRLLSSAHQPWSLEAINPDDLVTTIRAGQMTDLTKVFLDKANYMEEFAEGLECGFVIGLGVWKVWWGLKPRTVTKVQQAPDPATGQLQRQLIQEEVLEGQLFVRAVDPYNFYWLPGSKLNRWVGTIEEIEVPKYELMAMASAGLFDPAKLKHLQASKIDETRKQSFLRFSERSSNSAGGPADTETVKLTEFYGPLVLDGGVVEPHAHLLIANDSCVLIDGVNQFWTKKAPYVGFSPLALPFRTDGVGLVEMVRKIDKALSRLANLSVDTLLFRLMPLFEVNMEAYENPEDFSTGMTPGKIFKRNNTFQGQPGITPIQFQDISAGSIQTAGHLDRSHQEGSLVSEIAQGIPRYRGVQSATEVEEKSANQDSFFGNMAADIERQAIMPMVEMANDLIFQFIDSATDPRVGSILGVGAEYLKGMPKEELLELVQGDFKVKVTGLTGQLEKAEMLQNLVQFMNILGQNPETWGPYIKQDELLRRILEAFRPSIREIENIVADPATAKAQQDAAMSDKMTPELVQMIPGLAQMAFDIQKSQQEMAQAQAQMQQQMQLAGAEMKMKQMEFKLREQEIDAQMAQAKAMKAEASAAKATKGESKN